MIECQSDNRLTSFNYTLKYLALELNYTYMYFQIFGFTQLGKEPATIANALQRNLKLMKSENLPPMKNSYNNVRSLS